MPQSRQELRDKFMSSAGTGYFDDGIEKCEQIISKYGGNVTKDGLITIPKEVEEKVKSIDEQRIELWDAVEYLCDEWDFALVDKE